MMSIAAEWLLSCVNTVIKVKVLQGHWSADKMTNKI